MSYNHTIQGVTSDLVLEAWAANDTAPFPIQRGYRVLSSSMTHDEVRVERVCLNCDQAKEDHGPDDKCLFAPTYWTGVGDP